MCKGTIGTEVFWQYPEFGHRKRSDDPKLRVLIVHGWNDLSCPFMGSVLTVDQMPLMGDASRVQVQEFPGGHMFYTRTVNQERLHKLAETMVETH